MMPSGGVSGYFGYEYQFLASSLLLLNAHKNTGTPFKLSVETLFGEDAALEQRKEKRLNVEQTQSDAIVQVQVKTRQQIQHWRPSDLRDLLLKSDENNSNGDTVLDKLYSDPNSIFLFITDGSITESLSGLLINTLGDYKHRYGEEKLDNIGQAIVHSDRTAKYKYILAQKLTRSVLSRVFILANMPFEDIERQIREILLWDYAIPTHQVYEKADILTGLIRDCARRKNGRTLITDLEVTEIVGVAGVKLPNQEVEELYQKTREYDSAQTVLNIKHMLVIDGEPGCGKTTLAYKLVNEMVGQKYRFEMTGGENSHLDILRACLGQDNIVFLIDDGLGYDEYKKEWGEALGNNFEQISSQLQEAKGRVKVLITSRHDVIMQAYAKTKLSQSTLSNYLVSLLFPDPVFNLTVLTRHVEYLRIDPEIFNAVCIVPSLPDKFENLHHVRSFAHALKDVQKDTSQDKLWHLFEDTKPSLYTKWIEKQSTNIQLFLIALWLVSDIEQFAREIHVQNIFNILSTCFPLSPVMGFGNPYSIAIKDLLEKDRIVIYRNSIVDFVHPTLKGAVVRFFENVPDKKDFLLCACKTTVTLDEPLPQSIAVYLAGKYLHNDEQYECLSIAAKSKYLHTLDTFVRFGRDLLQSVNPQIKQLAESLYEIEFHPSECHIDDNGNLIIPVRDPGVTLRSLSDLSEIMEWEYIGFRSEKEPELVKKFREHLNEQSFIFLNPLEKSRFLDWLFDQYHINEIDAIRLVSIVEFLAVDPISFVRQRVAKYIGRLLNVPVSHSVIKALCFDSSPYVKIAVLEDVILLFWAKQNNETQAQWLQLVVSMLDDSIVRYRCTHGLVDQSGSLYFYHQDHTEEQKREWFAALAVKLLKHTFEVDHVDRFLSAFDKHYSFFSTPFRVDLLNSLNSYVRQNPFHAKTAVFTVEKIIFDENSSKEEYDVLLNLISHIPPIAKAELGFQIAYRFSELPDRRFEEFIHRPFYIEDPKEYVFERTAILLGYLANLSASKDHSHLPLPVREMGDGLENSIDNYINKQSDEFKLVLLFEVFGHEYASDVSARQHALYLHPTIKRLIDEFVVEKQDNPNTVFLAHSLLTDGYYSTNAHYSNKTEWRKYRSKLLSSTNTELLKAICDIIFWANIDSNVHNTKDWLVLLSNLLTHPNTDVGIHALALFDKYFFDIWPDISEVVIEERESGKKTLASIWANSEFLQNLLSISPSFNEYLETKLLFKRLIDGWQEFTKKAKDSFINDIVKKANVDKYYVNSLIEEFVEALGDRLNVEHKKELLSAITPLGEEYNHIHVLGRIKYLHSAHELRDLLPKFDWSKYIN